MLDEFDDPARVLPPAANPDARARTQHRVAVARLVSRVYRSAGDPLRARMLVHLIRPLGALGLAAVASGAFARLLPRDAAGLDAVAPDELTRYSGEQVLELAAFVYEKSPETLQQLAATLTHSAVGMTALTASAIVLLVRRVQAQATRAQ